MEGVHFLWGRRVKLVRINVIGNDMTFLLDIFGEILDDVLGFPGLPFLSENLSITRGEVPDLGLNQELRKQLHF